MFYEHPHFSFIGEHCVIYQAPNDNRTHSQPNIVFPFSHQLHKKFGSLQLYTNPQLLLLTPKCHRAQTEFPTLQYALLSKGNKTE